MTSSHSFLLDLSDHEILRILSYLWFPDLWRMRPANARLYHLISDHRTLAPELLCKQLQLNGVQGLCFDWIMRDLTVDDSKVIQLASRLAVWPTDIDTADLKHNLIEIQIPGQTSKCVSYAGATLGRNRSFVANNHFPTLGVTGSLESVSSFPFTKVVYNTELQCSMPSISGIAYYEITIHPQIAVAGAQEDPFFAPCVAIGIANHSHRMNKMPGWDSNSYGFHGDDGMFFHRWETEGFQFTDELSNAQFGQGDTVGFGIIYSKLSRRNTQLFLTKNGEYVGKLHESNPNFETCTWFPCVGTDAHCPIEMNFGNKGVAFAFDVVAFERDINRQCMCRLGTDAFQLANLPIVPAIQSVTFRQPYHQCNHFEGGLYRNRAFMKALREHLQRSAVHTAEESDSEGSEESEASEWETVDNEEGDEGDASGNTGSSEGNGDEGMSGGNRIEGSDGSEANSNDDDNESAIIYVDGPDIGSSEESDSDSEGSAGSEGSEESEESDFSGSMDDDSAGFSESEGENSLGSESTTTLVPDEFEDIDEEY